MRHVARNHQHLAGRDEGAVRLVLRIDLVAEPEAQRTLQDVRDLLVHVVMLRHDAACLEVDVRDHHLLAGDDAARQRGVELFERHGGP